MQQLLPEWYFEEPKINYVSRKRLIYFWRWYLLLFIPVMIGGSFIHLGISLGALILLSICLLAGWLDSYYQGYTLQQTNRLCIQNFVFFTKVQTFVERSKIQALAESTTHWLYPKKISHLQLTFKAGQGSQAIQLRFIDTQAGKKIQQFFRETSISTN